MGFVFHYCETVPYMPIRLFIDPDWQTEKPDLADEWYRRATQDAMYIEGFE